MIDTAVVDGSVAIKWFMHEQHDIQAKALLAEHKTGKLRIAVPDLFRAEIGNIVWK